MKDLGEPGDFMCLGITRNLPEHALHISQTENIDKVLERFGMKNAQPSATSMEISSKQSSLGILNNPSVQAPYYEAVGSFI